LPNIKSASKRARQSIKRRDKNAAVKGLLKTVAKKTELLIAEKKIDDAKTVLKTYYKFIDKAAGKGILKKNTAARRKSKLTRKINIAAKQ